MTFRRLFVVMLPLFFFVAPVALVPETTHALAPIVPCGTGGWNTMTSGGLCQACDIVTLAKNLIDFFVFLVVIVATLLFVNAGVLYIFSPANPGNISRAHHLFTSTLIGLIIVLASWLLVDTVMKALYDNTPVNSGGTAWGPWNQILCGGGSAPSTPPTATTTASLCTDAVNLAAAYNYGGTSLGEHPNLTALIACYRDDPPGSGIADPDIDAGQIRTWDTAYPLCNFTRGNAVCHAECSYAVNSWHYGDSCSGQQGAMAVDFNAVGGAYADELALRNKLLSKQSACGGTVLPLRCDGGNCHTQIQLSTCP